MAVVNLTTGQPCTSMDIHGLPRNSTCACSRAESWTRESWRDRSSPHSLGVDIEEEDYLDEKEEEKEEDDEVCIS